MKTIRKEVQEAVVDFGLTAVAIFEYLFTWIIPLLYVSYRPIQVTYPSDHRLEMAMEIVFNFIYIYVFRNFLKTIFNEKGEG